jgi:SAM-dependent methyltransferase
MSLREKLIDSYRKNFLSVVKPHIPHLKKNLFREKTSNREGSHSQNRYKYFQPFRHLQIADVFQRAFPEVGQGNIKILDLGCGFGEYIATALGLGNTCVGINGGEGWYIDDFLYVNKLLNLDVRVHNITKGLPFPDNSFDFCFSVDTMTLATLGPYVNYLLAEQFRVAKKIIVLTHASTNLNYNKEDLLPKVPRIYDWKFIVRDYKA